ncbi:polymorphic toxin-type HINT domain-containing protein [Streptomyces sp. NBC_00620]|uniref:polymorphic toxin-type HINT domain-containing protein n=1 Tax=Streptomyces sp. NBC_00620 TaxID=2903666 RepID=UPI00224F5C70|nr:polymorphic toxin-type HINT domain-containing protein [Streptomyces sp. NBC_00620]MCX4971328.1 polymorphic toxin-type HINT domain-containing protein [Streptomyces sp. NBC_00620]
MFRRAPGKWSRLLTTTALATATAIAITGGQLPSLDRQQAAATTDDPTVPTLFDLENTQQVREDQCLLNGVLRKGGPATKEVARAGLSGTEAQLHTAANREYWTATPLATSYKTDRAVADTKLDELAGRPDVWEESLAIPSMSTPPGYTKTGFEWVESDANPFDTINLSSWVAAQYWKRDSDLYTDSHPMASQESVDAATAIYNARYDEDAHEDYEDRQAWESMQFMHGMYADDARLFLQYGGFPTTAPDPDSMEFRIDVENLKARFASCAYTNPPDPHEVLGTELAVAATEWQDELAGQKSQRDAIIKAETQANADLSMASQALGEALAQSLIADRLTDWQAYWTKQKPADHPIFYPTAAEFAQVKKWIANAQGRASGRLFVASRAALSAKAQGAKVTKAQTEAYAIADAAGLPRGRGLMYGQQAAQVTMASAAAAQAAAKATETAFNATRASAADSKTLNALANTQAHAAKAEFRRKAAEEAAAQAKAASEGAAAQAAEAAKHASEAKAAENRAKAAEQTAKNAAADAKTKRQKAETERDYAKSQKELAEKERKKAQDAEAIAQSQRQVAADKLTAAQTAGKTASDRKDDALAAENKAAKARDKALEAESDRDTAAAKAAALEAKAEADEGTSAAEASRKAATDARAAADGATTAATKARQAADDATQAAADARAAATRAQGAAKRSQSAADGAKRDVAITNAAVTKAHAAAADAIDASMAAKWNAIAAKSEAETAQKAAVKAKGDALVARSEAVLAGADSIRAAGHAYSTAQAATAARDSAAQVVKPANDAIELGSPYAETDSSAGLAVLTGQASKTAAQQQAALANAKAAEAAKAAALAKTVAAQAGADAKAAAQAAADAAGYAASATKSAAEAQASSDAAAASAKAAKKSEANTVEYDRQATEDAAAAQRAADSAGGYASDADSAATDAERDAASARGAATAAEADAGTARDVADQAEADATVAEKAAANAQQSAKEAQDAATRTENAKAREDLTKGGATGIGGLFTRQKVTPLGDPVAMNECVLDGTPWDSCDVKFKMRYDLKVDFYLCQGSTDLEVSASTCPTENVTWLGSETYEDQTAYMTKTFTTWDVTKMVDRIFLNVLWDIFVQDFIDCSKGDVSGCAWAASNFVPGKLIEDAALALRGLDAALKTGVGVGDAIKALKKLDLDPQVLAAIELQVNILEDALTACRVNSFPGSTQVLMADGSRRAISEMREGDRLLASDPETGELRPQPVTDTFRHDTERLVDITVAGDGRLTSTVGHRFYVTGRGWTVVSDLRLGDRLRTPDGSVQPVTALRDRSGLAPREVYDLTVGGLHTFFVRTDGVRPQDVLVHNCLNIVGDEGVSGAHTLRDHVIPDAAAQLRADKYGIATKWRDQETAARAIDKAFQQWVTRGSNAKTLANWMTKQAQRGGAFDPTIDLKEIRWQVRDEGQLGTVFRRDGSGGVPTGNTVVIQLKYVKTHAQKFVVYTSYPE